MADKPSTRSRGLDAILQRIKTGELGFIPIILGLLVICVIFQTRNENFLTALNLTNLMVQIAAVGTISAGLVLILLLGEIDLSVGAMSGLAAAVMAVLITRFGFSGYAGIAAGIATGAAIGLFQGSWLTKLGIPSFIVTLAGLLAWQGAQLYVLGPTGTVNLTESTVEALANYRVPVVWGVGIVAVGLLSYVAAVISARRRRAREGMALPSWAADGARIALVCLAAFGAVAIMSVNRSNNANVPIQGVPLGVFLFLGIIVIMDLVIRRTRYGRYLFAVGGNPEAARRAGINVDRVRVSVFVIGSALAAFGGILAASRLYAVNQASGGGDVLLMAVAAPVIGGTSLFGGRGSAWSALLGVLVIGSISNGMDLLALSSSIKLMVTGSVLLVAVTVDALARRSRQSSGR